jgi:Asp-tRNA(Asn)/Glu-tRNA(Gln) amidotransferase A subunit family amidase
MSEPSPDTAAIVSAFAARERLELSPAEHERLCEYVRDSWDMADRLREVETPGLEGRRFDMPLRAAYSNVDAGRPASGKIDEAEVELTGIPAEELDRGLVEIAEALAAGKYTPFQLIGSQLERIERFDGFVRSYVNLDRDASMRQAALLTEELRELGPRSLLHGIPFGAKDNIPASGMACTYNSPFMRDWQPGRDAEAVSRLRAAGAVLVGKHNLNEFGWSLPTEHDLRPPPRNPWFPAEYSVGSSSGGGAAVSARLAVVALGTDGGGSVRLPAGQHLLFGLKPSHGRVPSAGVSGGRVSEVSILTRQAEDAAAVLAALLIDPDDADAARRLRAEPAERVTQVRTAPSRMRIAIPEAYLADVGMEPDVEQAMSATVRALRELGHEIVSLPRKSLDILHDAVRANFVVIAAEHYFDHSGPAKDRSKYGESAGFYNLPGACLTAADYLHAVRVGGIARDAIDAVFADHDLILTPTTPVTRSTTARNSKTHRRGGNAAYTSPFNISGHPGLSFPAGVSSEGIPIGMQFIGRVNSEFELLQAGRAVSVNLDLPAFPDLDRMGSLVHG